MTPVLAPNIAMMFEDSPLDLPDRLRVAAGWGAEAVEMWGWRHTDVDALAAAVDETGVAVCAMVVDPLLDLARAGRDDEVSAAVADTVEVARRLGCGTVVVASGAGTDEPRGAQIDRLVTVLGRAADIAGRAGVSLAVEALNSRPDHPHVLLDRLSDALTVADRVASAWLGVVVDTYHAGRMGEPITEVLAGRTAMVRHVQVAGPDRDEPRAGMAWMPDVSALVRHGHLGPLGLEIRTPDPEGAYHRSTALLATEAAG